MRLTPRYRWAAYAGAAVGIVCYIIAGNLEDWPFYAIRSRITGSSAMSQIVEHPADAWVTRLLLVAFVSLGASLGVLIARLGKSKG
jgi:hypothetical protein